jgi:hypothetical protein
VCAASSVFHFTVAADLLALKFAARAVDACPVMVVTFGVTVTEADGPLTVNVALAPAASFSSVATKMMFSGAVVTATVAEQPLVDPISEVIVAVAPVVAQPRTVPPLNEIAHVPSSLVPSAAAIVTVTTG